MIYIFTRKLAPFILSSYYQFTRRFNQILFEQITVHRNRFVALGIGLLLINMRELCLQKTYEVCHEKTDLKVFVIVTPKVLVWHRLLRIWVFDIFSKSRCRTQRRMGVRCRARPFFYWYDNDKDPKVCFLWRASHITATSFSPIGFSSN